MYKNYVTVALRNLVKHKAYSFINIGGLAVGIAGCLLITLYVLDELSYDRFHAKVDRIYRVTADVKQVGSDAESRNPTNGWPVGRLLKEEFSEVEAVCYIRKPNNPAIKHQGEYFYEETLTADENFLEVFSFSLLKGNQKTALLQPYSMLITEKIEQKYFGKESALGKTLILNDSIPYTVTGVLQNVPRNSHIRFDIALSFATFKARNPQFYENQGWFDLNMYNYALLRQGADIKAFAAKARGLAMRHASEQLKQFGYELYIGFQPLSEVYLNANIGNGLGPISNITYVYMLSAIAIFVLFIACINFTNLATARAVERAREVGVRKVIGSTRSALIGQFLSESFLTTVVALLFAFVLITGTLPVFNELANKSFTVEDILTPQLVAAIIILLLLVSLLAGVYPAFVLSGFKPVQVLKGTFVTSGGGTGLRKALVVVQFAISCSLIICTLVVLGQLRYMQSQDLGFTKEQVLVLDARKAPWAIRHTQYETLKQELKKHAAVKEVSATYGVPGRSGWQGQIVFPEGRPKDQGTSVEYMAVDHDFVRTFDLKVVAGRDLSTDFTSDEKNALLINETAVKQMGWETPENAIGKKIESPSGYPQGMVVGVIKDYHQHGLQEKIAPLVMDINSQVFGLFAIRLQTKDIAATMEAIHATGKQFFGNYPLEYFFLDDDFARQYDQEVRLTKIFTTFSTLAILIACLGLFGLVAFTTVQRTKEIGIRKVLGAPVGSIMAMLSKDFLKLVFIAFVIACPLAGYAMSRWLEDFAYRIDLAWWIFAMAGLLVLVIALLTISFQAIKAALANPVKSLRNE
jgi:putative ABC transport system permease protein